MGLLGLQENSPALIATDFLSIVAISTAYQIWSNSWIQVRTLLDR
jgi:hypothetical protein